MQPKFFQKIGSAARKLRNYSAFAGFSPRPATPSAGRPMVVGFLRSPIGLGAGARRIFGGFDSLGFQPSSFDVTTHIQPARATLTPLESTEDDGRGPVIVHVNPPEIPATLALLGRRCLAGRYLIGYWAWELEEPPESWRHTVNWFDEIWAPSTFTAQALAKIADVPVYPIGYPCLPLEPDLAQAQEWRQRLGLEGKFSCLAVYDPHSSFARKNPEAAVRAFQSAFPDDPDVTLVLKSLPSQHLRDTSPFAGDPRIVSVENSLSEGAMLSLIAATDCVLNLHRSEGYGLLPATATALGKPAIVTAWSSVTDFMDCPAMVPVNYELVRVNDPSGQYKSEVAEWAEPDLADAARLLRMQREKTASERTDLSHRSVLYWQHTHSPKEWSLRIPATSRNLMQPGNEF